MDATKLLNSIGQIPIVRGDNRGQLVKDVIQPWQVKFIKNFCKPKKTSLVFSCGRGNGKSAMLGWLSICFMHSDLYPHFDGDELIVLSSSIGSFAPVAKLIKMTLKKMGCVRPTYKLVHNDQRFRIVNSDTDCELRLIPSSVAAQHGLIAKWVFCDEFSQFQKPDYTMSSLDTGGGKEPESKLVFFGTLPRTPEHPLNTLISTKAEDLYAHIAQAPNDELTWKNINKANPVLKVLPSLKLKLKSELARAKKSDRARASFVALRLNLGGAEVALSLLVSAKEWRKILDVPVPPNPFGAPCWGVDLSSVKSMSCLTSSTIDEENLIRIESLGTFGSATDLKTREQQDNAIGVYTKAVERGDLFMSSTKSASIKELLEAGLVRFGRPSVIVCDRFKFAEMYDIAQDIDGLKGVKFAPQGMGYKTSGQHLRKWDEVITERRLAVVNPVLLTYALQFAEKQTDAAGNQKLVKTKDQTHSYARNDIAASSLLAIYMIATMPRQIPMTPERMKLLHSAL